MKLVIVLNDPPYGSERTCNGLRLAGSLARQQGSEVKVFLIGDAASNRARTAGCAAIILSKPGDRTASPLRN